MPAHERKVTTADGNKDKQVRVRLALKIKANWERSNRDLAAELAVDEATVRKYRAMLKVPKLTQGSGEPEDEPAPKRRRKRK